MSQSKLSDVRGVLAVCLLLAFTLVVATSGSTPDVVTIGQTEALSLEPTGEGTYTKIDEETGEIEIVLTEENPNIDGNGINKRAITEIGPVFTIRNVLEQDTTTDVWIEHDGESAEFYADRCGTCIDSRDGAVTLQPGETVTVALRVDTRGVDEEVLLSGVTVMAHLEPPGERRSGGTGGDPGHSVPPATPMETPTDKDKAKSGSTSTVTPTDTPTPTDTSSSSGTDTSAQGDGATSTSTDSPQEEAGLTPWLLGGLAAVVCLAGGGLLLSRRLGYI